MLAVNAPLDRAAREGRRPLRLEVKYDGFRALAARSGKEVALISRNQLDFAPRYPELIAALSRLRIQEVVLDGEIVGLDPEGRSRFERMGLPGGHHYVLFDVLWWKGKDVRALPLEERVALLDQLGVLKPPLVRAEVIEGAVGEALVHARQRQLEGLIAKRPDAPYRGGRTTDWLKLKVQQRQEVVVVGFTPLKNGVAGIGALLLAVWSTEERALVYAGKVGTGFDDASRRRLYAALKKAPQPDVPVKGAPRMKDARWVAPGRIAEVAFTEWTADGRLRHPVFLGLREDKAWKEVVREPSVSAGIVG
jgi:bifunctional non-homologous end joining protein LigD